MTRSRLSELLRADVESHDAQLFTTPHLSRIRHAEEALLKLLEERTHPEPSTAAAAMAARATGLPVTEVVLGGEEAPPGPIHVLIATIRSAISEYDRSGDHCPHQSQSDCVRCNAASAVYHAEDPRARPPRRRAS